MPDLHRLLLIVATFSFAISSSWSPAAYGQGTHCDPSKVLTSAGCVKCHAQAEAVWRQTAHHKTFATLYKMPEAKLIAQKMGIVSIKRGDVCIKCHYTRIEKDDGKLKPVSGVSCESCHGAGKDWVPVHNDYGGVGATKLSESTEHARQRYETSVRLGMRNPKNLYDVAQSCLGCHTVPNEELVNVGGHSAGSLEFDLVSWSQGTLRHNFLRTGGKQNAVTDGNRLRVMFVAGLIADLEYSTRAVATATQKEKYGLTVAKRAATQSLKLYELQQRIKSPQLEQILRAFAKAELKVNNKDQLLKIADEIAKSGREFAQLEDGTRLASVDEYLPPKNLYK